MSTRSYKDAVEHLNSLQSNAATLDAARAANTRMTSTGILDTLEYLERIGYKPEDLNAMNVIHITGTKGKGSTSAFTDSILRRTKPDWKIGLYTSPHLVAVRERIRINGQPLSEEDFAKYFFEVWDRLQANTARKREDTPLMPAYFRFITLVAFHVFLEMKVDATVLEVGVGGTYDCTNIVPTPVVTGVTALGIDHVNVLGKTLKEIAWQKGGIYKSGVPALTVPQPEEGMVVLRERAEELKASEFIITPPVPGFPDLKLGLAGAHQYQNATIAAHLARTFLRVRDSYSDENPLPAPFVEGLKNAKWPGRCQMVPDPVHLRTTWFLDGAHTVESLDCCIDWFVSPGQALPMDTTSTSSKPRVLIFNCTSGRSGPSFLGGINQKIISQLEAYKSSEDVTTFFDEVVFCANVTYADGAFKGDLTAVSIPEADLAELKTQHQLADAWSKIHPTFPKDKLHVLPSIEHAVRIVHKLGEGERPVDVLVTGSLHLVGGVIEVAGLSKVAL
ncbi:FolC bifunctional protein [Dendrothele bispora CBS 962.96]|uniref:Folylpolyglutamate synthase n=1 Tax=Dendrothele bispora (strain CBS 962.96) TaxID=1314807 RepID=A0A4S8MY77_DENBC|nr:FolC bifunctional protein [Dendrothele bispora CBS 962.96]